MERTEQGIGLSQKNGMAAKVRYEDYAFMRLIVRTGTRLASDESTPSL